MVDSCKGNDGDNIDNRYHQRLSDEDWKPDWRITHNHFVARNQRSLAMAFSYFVLAQLKCFPKKNDNKMKYTLVYAVATLEKSNVKI